MRMILLTVGKTDVAWVREGLSLYAARLAHYVPFSLVEIPQLKNVKPADRVILLDERGRELRSMAFAAEIGDHLSREGRDLVFVIGGAYGFSKAVYARADGMLSLSKMTFSHQMVRTVFAEQLYRAFTILKGEPYHHEG